MSTPIRPDFNYAAMPYLAREGIQGPNNKFLTRGLFLETAPEDAKPNAPWCLSEHEIFAYGKWYPSAWMVYIHSTDEYDALRKICGNVRQWEHLKSMRMPKDFSQILETWRLEQAYYQRSQIREQLLQGALSGQPGYTAACRMLLQMIDGPKTMGRPKKEVVKPDQTKDVDADAERVSQLFPAAQ